MPHYKLTYFNVRWLGEGARLLFHYADIPFEDVRIREEDWPKIKPSTPFGHLPILDVDGTVIPESAAIYRFLGRKFGLTPKSPLDEALVDAIYDAHKEFLNDTDTYVHVVGGYIKGDKDKLLKEVALPARDRYLPKLELYLQKSGSGYLVGRALSWADIVIADHLATWETFIPEFFEGHSEVKKFIENIRSLPKLKKWIETRPKTAM